MESVATAETKIRRVTEDLWQHQGRLDVDQVDGTFFIHVCKAKEIADLQAVATSTDRHYMYAEARIRQYLPNAPESVFSPVVIPEHPRLREPVDMSVKIFGSRLCANGEVIERQDFESDHTTRGQLAPGLAWVRLGIRNREWKGRDVVRAIMARAPLSAVSPGLSEPAPPYHEQEAMSLIGATLYCQGQYGIRMYWDPEREVPPDFLSNSTGAERERRIQRYRGYPPEAVDENGYIRIKVDNTDPRWDMVSWPPMILISVAEPLPPPELVQSFYDGVVIHQRRWHEHLLGANNGQSVQVAIRTWAIGLLTTCGKTFMDASRIVHSIVDTTEVGQKRFQEDRGSLLRRAPEAEQYLKRNPSTNS